jgi:hypothetical protein
MDFALHPNNKTHVKTMQTDTGTKDKVAQHWIDIVSKKASEMHKATPSLSAESIAANLRTWLFNQPGDKFNPLLSFPGKIMFFFSYQWLIYGTGLDPAKDTPIEILHTYLLGLIKYVWYQLHSSWNQEQQDLFVARLQSMDTGGLSVPPLQALYMMQYRNNLIGKHFKALSQTFAFCLAGIVSSPLLALVNSACELGAYLWMPKITDMTLHLVCCESCLFYIASMLIYL